LDPRLLASIEAVPPSDELTFILTELGRPFTSGKKFSGRMLQWSREAGLNGCPLHGLRKAFCRRLAEAGCSVNQIAAISGHKSLSEVERYTRAADQVALADEAIAKMQPGTDGARRTTHTPVLWVERSKKA
jgi:integrase